VAADVPGFGAVAQLGERLVRNEEVSGSIPLSSTKYFFCPVPMDGRLAEEERIPSGMTNENRQKQKRIPFGNDKQGDYGA
jgi:hypothetical protein